MMWDVTVWIFLGWCATAMLYMVVIAVIKPPVSLMDEVPDLLRPVDLERAETLLDPAADYALRWNLDATTFGQVQRGRARLFLELLGRMAHNARVLVELANRQVDCYTGRKAEVIRALQQEAVRVRMYALFTLLKLRLWMLLRPAHVPSLVRFRNVVDVDGIASYKAMRQASTAVFEEFGLPVDKLILNY
jgi:hypothetical protein